MLARSSSWMEKGPKNDGGRSGGWSGSQAGSGITRGSAPALPPTRRGAAAQYTHKPARANFLQVWVTAMATLPLGGVGLVKKLTAPIVGLWRAEGGGGRGACSHVWQMHSVEPCPRTLAAQASTS